MKKLVAILAAATFAFANAALAANIALFADTAYVNYIPANSSAEASNMEAALVSQGHTVTTFTGTAAANWTTALAGAQVLVIPEQEVGPSLAGALPAATITVIQNFVNGGGRLIVADDYRTPSFLNGVFGFSMANGGGAGTYTLNGAAAAGTPFEGGPASIPDLSAVDTMVTSSLPAGAKCMYSAGLDCAVMQLAQGAGVIVYLGWDFFNANPVGSANGGWVSSILPSAVGLAAFTSVPALGPLQLAALAAVLALLGVTVLRRRSI